MNIRLKKTTVKNLIHGNQIKNIPISHPNFSSNTNYHEIKTSKKDKKLETVTKSLKYNSGFSFQGNKNKKANIDINNISNNKYSYNNNSYNNKISLIKSYKSSLNNAVKKSGNTTNHYHLKSGTNNSRIKPLNTQNISNLRIYNESNNNSRYNTQINKNRINNSNQNSIKTNISKGGKSSYRRRNENNPVNIEQKKNIIDKIHNKTKRNNYSFDIYNTNHIAIRNNNYYSNNIPSSNIDLKRNDFYRPNNRIKKSKTNDNILKGIVNEQETESPEKNNNSFLVNTTGLNNYKFYISKENYLNNDSIRHNYNRHTQPILQMNDEYNSTNPYINTFETENYDDHDFYNDNTYNGINKLDNNLYKANFDYNYKNNYKKTSYDNSNRLLKPYNNIHNNINTIPIPINKNKKKKKVAKFKLNQLKELRENEFKIDKNKINKKEDENVEEYIEKYFDKDGKCIGGKKTVIKQEYENGQKIIKKFVEEKYKSNSSYEFLKKQEENNYDIHNKKSSKKETIISSSKKDSYLNMTSENLEDENNNINTIVTFGVNSKNSRIDEDLYNTNEEKEADEQIIEINPDFDDEEIENKNFDLDEKDKENGGKNINISDIEEDEELENDIIDFTQNNKKFN